MPCMCSYCSQDLAVNVVCSSATYLRATRLLHVRKYLKEERPYFLDEMGLGLESSSVPEQTSDVSLLALALSFHTT